MNIVDKIVKNSNCYKEGKTITVKGLMLHSVGCAQPDPYYWVSLWDANKGNNVCTHGIIGTDGTVVQTLPWNRRGWHCASGSNGSGNDTHIGVESAEPEWLEYIGTTDQFNDPKPEETKKFLAGTYKTAVELFAYLCKEYNLNPLQDGVVISHQEGHAMGIASNHTDVYHIWHKYGLTMDQFRKDVAAAMNGQIPDPYINAAPAVLVAAAKVYAAMKIANPKSEYSSQKTVTLNIDGTTLQCRCDCTGVIQAVIRYMGYDPNWGSSSVSGHTGDGWYLSDATSDFVKDTAGNISPDWKVLDFDANDARPGDIRAHNGHSHCDIFAGYKGATAYGLNAGSTGGIQASADAGTAYQSNENLDLLLATTTIQDKDTAKVLRYIKEASTSGTASSGTASQTLDSLEIQLGFVQPLEFIYKLRDSSGEFSPTIPGYFPAIYTNDSGTAATDRYSDAWLEFVVTFKVIYSTNPEDDWHKQVKEGLVMLYTLDNSDPMEYGKTVITTEDGANDYEASKNLGLIIRTEFPAHFRCVVVDYGTKSKVISQSSAYFTNQSVDDRRLSIASMIKVLKNSLFLADAAGKSYEAEDNHGYLFLNDEDSGYNKENYTSWVYGKED